MTSDLVESTTLGADLPAPVHVPGWPFLGNALDFLYRPMEFFLDCYHRYGPIFHISAANQRYVVMAGLEANRFLAQDKDELFSSCLLYTSPSPRD